MTTEDEDTKDSASGEALKGESRPATAYLRILVVLLILGMVMGFSVLLLKLKVAPVLLVPIDTVVVAAAIRVFRTAFNLPGADLDAEAARRGDE